MSVSRTNFNLALNTNFKIEIPNARDFNYFVQTINIPGISCGKVDTTNMNHRIFFQGDTIEYEELDFSFVVNEDFSNYQYIHNWIIDYRDHESAADKMQDLTLHILNNNKLAFLKFVFHDAFPIALGAIDLEHINSDSTPITCATSFAYSYFSIEKLRDV